VIFLLAAFLTIPQVKASPHAPTGLVKAERLLGEPEDTYKYEEFKDGSVKIDDVCYEPTKGKESNYYVPCGKPDDKGLNLPNCLILEGKWSKEKNQCLIDGYWFGYDEAGIPTIIEAGMDI
jgi:hypothetical protein